MSILKGIAAPLFAISFFAGCSSSISNIEDTPTETEILQKKASKIYSSELAIKNKIASLKEILEKEEHVGWESDTNRLVMTPAAYYGPSYFINEDDYELKKYSEEPLLFSGNGIKNKLPILFYDIGTAEELNLKANMLGYSSLENMFDKTYELLKSKSLVYISIELKDMTRKGIIKDNAFSASKINEETEKIINVVFSSYFMKEKERKLIPEWFYLKNGDRKTITKEDYRPYGFIISLIKDNLKNTYIKKGEDNE